MEKASMKSIAVWCSKKNQALPSLESIELHFNLWKLPTEKMEYERFIDIGFKIDSSSNVDSLKLYFPYSINKEDISDVVGNFIKNESLVDSIFNENYKIISQTGFKYHQVLDVNNNHVFDIYKLDPTDYKLEYKHSGTILAIDCIQSNSPKYYRFRISNEYLNTLFTIQDPPNAKLQSAFSQLEVTDFRVNEVRDLDTNLLAQIQKENQLKISKAHFFFICSSEEEIVGSHLPYLNCRNLEYSRWAPYIDLPDLKKSANNLAYHWKWQDKKDLSLLIKSKYEQNNWKTITIYLVLFILIGIVINLLSNYIWMTVEN